MGFETQHGRNVIGWVLAVSAIDRIDSRKLRAGCGSVERSQVPCSVTVAASQFVRESDDNVIW